MFLILLGCAVLYSGHYVSGLCSFILVWMGFVIIIWKDSMKDVFHLVYVVNFYSGLMLDIYLFSSSFSWYESGDIVLLYDGQILINCSKGLYVLKYGAVGQIMVKSLENESSMVL